MNLVFRKSLVMTSPRAKKKRKKEAARGPQCASRVTQPTRHHDSRSPFSPGWSLKSNKNELHDELGISFNSLSREEKKKKKGLSSSRHKGHHA